MTCPQPTRLAMNRVKLGDVLRPYSMSLSFSFPSEIHHVCPLAIEK